MFAIHKSNKTIGFTYNHRHYVIGFSNVMMARKVQYSMNKDPIITMVRSDIEMDLSKKVKEKLVIDLRASLFITKGKRDDQLHLETCSHREFLMFPYEKNVGIVMPYQLIDESEVEFHFKAHVVEPADSIGLYRLP
jgi:hypothetical protein